MLPPDADYHLRLAEFRRKSADGTITLDEMREAVKLMRQGRVAAAAANEKARAKKTTKAVDSDALLDTLEGL